MLNENCQDIQIKEITQKQVWEGFLMGCEEKTFLDSWNWGEFQKKMGYKIWRLGIYSNKQLIAAALVVKITAKRGSFLFIPHSPVIQSDGDPLSASLAESGSPSKSPLKSLLEKLKEIAKQENCSFIRISPIWPARNASHSDAGGVRNEENIKVFKDLGFRDAPIHMHPESTWELDIRPSEDELLMNMRKTTRYLIRQAQKNKDIEIIQTPAFAEASAFGRRSRLRPTKSAGKQNLEDVEKFNQLYQDTKTRHHFTPFSLNYLKNEFLSFTPDNQPIRQAQGCHEVQISIFFVKYKNEIISSAMIIFWQGIGFYHQGASSQKYSKIPVSYLLQWEAIKEAKKRGCKIYNFWGIAPSFKKRHPWYGLSLFKMGFGGYKKEYVKTQDLVLSPKYWINFIIERLRKTKRGL